MSKMSGGKMIVRLAKNGHLELLVIGDVDAAIEQ